MESISEVVHRQTGCPRNNGCTIVPCPLDELLKGLSSNSLKHQKETSSSHVCRVLKAWLFLICLLFSIFPGGT